MNETISIIVPVYNTEKYLVSCVRSLLAQTYSKLEILLIDDGSGKVCAGLCDELAAGDARIRVIHQKNAGLSGARNRGLEEASGNWILFVDSDDTVEPDCCEKALQSALKNKADAVIFLYRRLFDSEDAPANHRRGKTDFTMESRVLSKEEAMLSLLDNRIGNYAWNRLCRKELYKDIRYPEGRLYEDIGTTWKVMEAAGTVCFLAEELYNYIQHTGSISNADSKRSVTDDFLMREELWTHLAANYPRMMAGNEYFILAPALKFCRCLKKQEEPDVYGRALNLLKQAPAVPDAFSGKQKMMMRLLLRTPALFELTCSLMRRLRGQAP